MSLDTNEFREILDEHGNRIGKLEVDMSSMKEKLNNIESSVTRFETAYYQNTNSLFQSINQLVSNATNNATELTKATTNNVIELKKEDHKNITKVFLKVLGVISACVLSALGAKYGLK